MIITGGRTTSDDGAGILVEGPTTDIPEGGQLTLISSTVTGNTAGGFGGDGGGIFVEQGASAEIVTSTISDNVANASGGGIYVEDGGGVHIVNSTISDNYAAAGGGMRVFGDATAVNATFHGNYASNYVGGVDVTPSGSLDLVNSTITGNVSGNQYGGLRAFGGSDVEIGNSIIIGNYSTSPSGDDNVSGTYTDLGGNVVSTSSNNVDVTDVFDSTETINGVLAGQLGDNGGPVETVALLDSTNNPARDVGDEDLLPADGFDLDNDGDTTESLPVDANGDPRLLGTGIDAGAVELICFARGTAIATPDGERRVEHLRIGDRVLTGDGRAVPARWIGRQTVSMRFQMP
ncbi:MAG: right-handed parallel beta-helix repeat-containing protein, partial [Pseudomonadota bacterium]